MHGVGSGKTMTAIRVAEQFKDIVKKYNTKIYVLVPGPNTRENFKKELINTTGDTYLKNKESLNQMTTKPNMTKDIWVGMICVEMNEAAIQVMDYLMILIIDKYKHKSVYILFVMSLYILIENQKLIWETMNKIPQFQEYGKYDHTEQQKWFQHIIQQFYENNKFKLLSVQELQQLNRETVGYMIRELKNIKAKTVTPVYSNFSSPQYDRFDEPTVFTEMPHLPSSSEKKQVTRDYLLEKKQEELNRQFSARQNEYSSMLKKGPGLEIDFRLPMDKDEPIENIEELIKSQLNQRNIEFPINETVNEFKKETDKEIMEPISTIVDEIKPLAPRRSEQFPFQDISELPPNKNVQWANDLEVNSQIHHPPSYSMKEKDRRNEEFKLIKEFMIEMKDIVQGLRSEMEDMKKTMAGSVTKKTEPIFKQPIPESNYLLNEFYGDIKPNLVIHSTEAVENIEIACDEFLL
jgi:hypothetical protein